MRNADGVYGVTYRWGNSLTNATLVPELGLDEPFTISDHGILRTQVWHYPGRGECLICHSAAGGLALGFNSAQMNRDFTYDDASTNQLAALDHAGYFTTPIPALHTMRSLVNWTNTEASLDYRVHSYLAANCVQCHQPTGAALGLWDARITSPWSALVNLSLVDNQGSAKNKVVVPGVPQNSMLLQRISNLGPAHMPPLATRLLDQNAIALVTEWIVHGLTNAETFSSWQQRFFNSTTAPGAASNADPDADGASNLLEYLTGTDPLSDADFWQISAERAGGEVQIAFTQIAGLGFEVQYRDEAVRTSPSSGKWRVLDVPENAPYFSSQTIPRIVRDSAQTSTARFYRVRVYRP